MLNLNLRSLHKHFKPSDYPKPAFLKLWSANHLWPSRSALVVLQKHRRKNKIQMNRISHYSWKSQSLEMARGNILSLFLALLTFYEIAYPARLPTSQATKSWTWCFSPYFPCTSGTAPVTQPGTTRVHNTGLKYQTFPCIYDILNSFAYSQFAHWKDHVLYVVHQ